MPPATAPDAPWFVAAFDERYLKLYAHRDEDEAEARTPGIMNLLGVVHGKRVLDVACGEGRYSRALARRGVRVTGIDLSKELLLVAREKSRLLPGCPQFIRRDMRKLPFVTQFDAAISMFTSFGYFETDAEDLLVLRGVERALVPGGRFLLDFMNESQLRSSLVPEETQQSRGARVHIKRWIDEDALGGPRVEKRVEAISDNTGLTEFEVAESVRLYTPDEIDAQLERAGLVPVGERMGSVDGAPLDAMASRLVRLAEKPVV